MACATTTMRNNNESPVRIKPTEDNPLKEPWDNKPEIVWKFGINYLASEGLTETSEESRAILVYIQHGNYWYTRSVRKEKKFSSNQSFTISISI